MTSKSESSCFLSTCFLVLFTAFMLTTARAEEISKTHLVVAKQAIKASKISAKLDDILFDMGNEFKVILLRSRPDKEAEISRIVDKQTLLFAKRRGDLENEIARIYADKFSVEELKEIISFFSGNTGTKFINNFNFLEEQVNQAAEVWAVGINRDMSEKIEEEAIDAKIIIAQ